MMMSRVFRAGTKQQCSGAKQCGGSPQHSHSAPALLLLTFALLLLAGTPVSAASKHPTVFNGIDYAPVYSYNYYIRRHPALKARCGGNDRKVLQYYVLHGYPKKEKAKKGATDSAFAAVQKARIAKYLPKTKTALLTDQIIVVVDHELSLWNKKSDGSWKRKLKAYCGYGKNGLSSNRHAGDMTTPVGAFPILHAFGTAEGAVSAMEWKQITPNSYWSAERDTYNTWVESSLRMSGEHLIDYYQYLYAMAIGFNIDPPVYGKGSAIFLHCKSFDHWYTAGCVSVENRVMKKLLKLCGDGTYIIIVPKDTKLKKY